MRSGEIKTFGGKLKEFFKKPVMTVAFMMGATVLAKLLGMLRTILLALNYGTGVEASAFSLASRVPLTFFDLLFSSAILGCFIPVYNSFADDTDGASEFASSFLAVVLLATGALSVVGMLGADIIVRLLGPGLSAETAALAVRILRIMFPMVVFTGSTYTLVGVMQSRGRFLLPAFISSISNAGVIVYFLFFDGFFGIYGLSIAYIVSWLIQLLTLAIPLKRDGVKLLAGANLKNPALFKAIKMSLPVMLGSWLAPIGLLAGTFFSTFVAENGNVIFEYAVNAFTMAAGILTYSICNYLFPSLAKLSSEAHEEEFLETSRSGIIPAAAIILPFSAALTVLSGECIAAMYMRGDFTASDAASVASLLCMLVLSMPAFAGIEIFSRIFYARSLPWIPMVSAGAGIAVNIVSASVMVFGFDRGMNAIGISYSIGLYAAVAVLVLFSFFKLKGLYNKKFAVSMLKVVFAAVVFSVVSYFIYSAVNNDPYSSSTLKNILVAMAVFVPSAIVYVVLIRFSGVFKGGLKSRK